MQASVKRNEISDTLSANYLRRILPKFISHEAKLRDLVGMISFDRHFAVQCFNMHDERDEKVNPTSTTTAVITSREPLKLISGTRHGNQLNDETRWSFKK